MLLHQAGQVWLYRRNLGLYRCHHKFKPKNNEAANILDLFITTPGISNESLYSKSQCVLNAWYIHIYQNLKTSDMASPKSQNE